MLALSDHIFLSFYLSTFVIANRCFSLFWNVGFNGRDNFFHFLLRGEIPQDSVKSWCALLDVIFWLEVGDGKLVDGVFEECLDLPQILADLAYTLEV